MSSAGCSVLLVKGNYGLSGGPETLIAALARHFAPNRVSASLVILRRPGVPEAAQLAAARLAIEREYIEWPGLASAASVAWKLRRVARQRRAALIHSHDMRANLVACLLRKTCGIAWIAHVHGWLGRTHKGKWRYYEALDRRLIRHADLVLVGSSAAQQEVHAAGAKQVRLLPNAVEVPRDDEYSNAGLLVRSELGIPPEALVAGVVGRVHPGKGQVYLLQAVAQLRREGSNVHAIVVGEGPDLERLKAMAGELGLRGAAHFPGYCPDIAPYTNAMDVFVAPSLKESLPLSVLEAMAVRRAVITSAVGDLPRVIEDGVNGFLTPPGDAAAIAGALRRFAMDRSLCSAMGERARATIVERFSAESMTRRMEDLYIATTAGKMEAECR